jgi:asparagine synthase (glutamine-hydrolysing)
VNKAQKTAAIQIKIHGVHGRLTSIGNHFHYIGQAMLGEQILSAPSLLQYIKQSISQQQLAEGMLKLNGFYAFTYQHNDTVYAVTDRLRSRPLFYCIHKKTLYLSDSTTWLNQQYSGKSINRQGEIELIRAGYISGEDTLITEMKQIEAATLFTYQTNSVKKQQYYHFIPKNSSQLIADSTLFAPLDKALTQSINRLISLANGRQIVIPLSGGFDSRIIALYLKQANYHNIVTFTFGTTTSQEVRMSQSIANGLNLPWHFVEYNRKRWREEQKSTDFNAFLLFISSFTSVPNVQVYPAIKALRQNGVINPNAIIVPGHTGDFSSGGHIPATLMAIPAQGNAKAIVNSIIGKHYHCKTPADLDSRLIAKISLQVDALLQVDAVSRASCLLTVNNQSPACSIYEAWEFNERQAKFIVNSNRYYDYWELDWWMPLWDNALIDFWQHTAPLANRQDSRLWQAFINLKSREMLSEAAPQTNASAHYSAFTRRIRAIFDYFTDPNALYALVPFHRWLLRKLKHPKANGTVFSYLAEKISADQQKQIK